MSWQLASFAVLGAVLLGGFAWYERSKPPAQVLALVAALAALAVAGRLVLAPIPNVVATTDIVIFSGLALGAAPGFAVGALAGLISNFWLGQGPWTPWQMAGWGLCGMLGALLAGLSGQRPGRLQLAAVCGFAGVAYGALLNFSLMVSYGGELSLDRFLALQGRAVPFDVAHAAGNVTLALIAGPAMVRMLVRFRERFEFRWASAGGDPSSAAGGPGLLGKTGTGAAALLVAIALTAAGLASNLARAAPLAPPAAWLERAQNADGGFPADLGDESSPEMTGWAMLGLEAAGRSPLDVRRGGATPVGYLRREAASIRSTGDFERTILALRGAGISPRSFGGQDLVSKLRSRRDRDGSFDGQVNLTAFGVLALRAAGSGGSTRRSLTWLRRGQNPNGGWGFTRGAPSDSDSTGAALQAVHGSRASRRGVGFLRRTQKASGGWPLAGGGTVNTQSTAWAIQGLVAAGADPGSVRRGGRTGLDYLAAHRAADGHYRYSSSSDQTPVWVTGQALVAATLKPFPLAAVPRESGRSIAGSAVAGGAASRGEKGGAGPSRNGVSKSERNGQGRSPSGPPSKLRERKGSGAAPSSRQRVAAAEASGGASHGAAEDGDGGGTSPLAPIGIGLAAGTLVVGGTWWLARRLLW